MPGPFTITKLRRDPDGVWRARVSCDGCTVDVDRRYGSWQAEVRAAKHARTFTRHDIPRPVAAELQRRVKRLEGRERRGACTAEATAL